MPRVATIEDVASRAGVSVATVSRALRGLPHVSPATREKVRRIAAELDYRPNPHASRLAAGRSGTIGVALPVLNSWFYGNVLAGVEAVVADQDLDLHLVTVDGPEAMEHFVSELPSLSKRVDGLLVVDVFLPDQLWDDLAGVPMPVATIGLDPGRFDTVTIDNRTAAREAVEYLLDLGHERVAFIGGDSDRSYELESANLRRAGMVDALTARGLRLESELEGSGVFSVAGGRDAMRDLLDGARPTAVFCASDEMAIGALWAAEEAGVAVPDRLSVIGFDDQPVAEAIGLSTVHQPVSTMAARAASLVLERLAESDRRIERVVFPTRLEKRRTTDTIT